MRGARRWAYVAAMACLITGTAIAMSGGRVKGAVSASAQVAASSSLSSDFPKALVGSCVRVGLGGGKPKESIARLPMRVTEAFGVFRRGQRREDLVPRSALTDVGRDFRLVFASYVRRVGQIASGAAYFVVPGRASVGLSRRCLQRLGSSQRARQRKLAVAASKVLLLCLDDFENGGGDYCYSARDALAGRAFASADGPEPPRGTAGDPSAIPVSVSVLAPDGAATLEAMYPGEAPIAAQITNNFATFVHTIHLAPNATRFPNLNPRRAIFKRADGSVTIVSHPAVDAPRFGDR